MSRKLFLLALLTSLAACGNQPSSTPKNEDTAQASDLTESKSVDCSEAYNGESATCTVVQCLPKYQEFIGEWKGPFESYDQHAQEFCPYDNTISYSESDCLKNQVNGEVFIIGRRDDIYKQTDKCDAKEKSGLLITGVDADEKPFLRTIDEEGLNSYQMEYKSNAASMSIWSLSVNSEDTPMKFTTIDGRDFTQPDVHKRNVVVTLSVGKSDAPQWEGVIVHGYHTHQQK